MKKSLVIIFNIIAMITLGIAIIGGILFVLREMDLIGSISNTFVQYIYYYGIYNIVFPLITMVELLNIPAVPPVVGIIIEALPVLIAITAFVLLLIYTIKLSKNTEPKGLKTAYIIFMSIILAFSAFLIYMGFAYDLFTEPTILISFLIYSITILISFVFVCTKKNLTE